MNHTFGIKYLLTAIETNSKKYLVYGIAVKKDKNLIIYIKELRIHNNIQKELTSDIGTEFKNKIFNDFYEDNDISFFQGPPYTSHSKGIVQRFNYTIKTYLSKEYFELEA